MDSKNTYSKALGGVFGHPDKIECAWGCCDKEHDHSWFLRGEGEPIHTSEFIDIGDPIFTKYDGFKIITREDRMKRIFKLLYWILAAIGVPLVVWLLFEVAALVGMFIYTPNLWILAGVIVVVIVVAESMRVLVDHLEFKEARRRDDGVYDLAISQSEALKDTRHIEPEFPWSHEGGYTFAKLPLDYTQGVANFQRILMKRGLWDGEDPKNYEDIKVPVEVYHTILLELGYDFQKGEKVE